MHLRNITLCLVLLGAAAGARAGEVAVAAAADLQYALDEVVQVFQAAAPATTIKVTYGSSGNFYAQLHNRAPFDLYLSADVAYPRRLAEAGLALDDDVFLYAIGRIVVWVPQASPLDVDALGWQALLEPSVRRIAVANPRHAPYGMAAVAAMQSLGVYQQVERRLVYGENIAQTAQFVQSRAADVGIIALSLALAPPLRAAGRYWQVPLEAYPTMEQGGLILGWARDPPAARAFRDFLLGPQGRAILERYGFEFPWTGKPSG